MSSHQISQTKNDTENQSTLVTGKQAGPASLLITDSKDKASSKSLLASLPSLSHPIEIDSSDLIRVIEQFLLENNLTNSLMALQKESGVSLNYVVDVQRFLSEISQGNWERVLSQVAYLSIPTFKLIDLFEQICIELAEGNDHTAALFLIERSPVVEQWKSQLPDRYQRIVSLLRRKASNPLELYPAGSNRERRRMFIRQSFQNEVQDAPPSRLMELVTQALRFRALRGALPQSITSTDPSNGHSLSQARPFEIFFANTPDAPEEHPPTKLSKVLQMGEGATAKSLCFSPDGQYIISGSSDGFIEAWDVERGALSVDLTYQAKGQFLMHESGDAVVALAFAVDGELLASATSNGEVKIWKFYSGEICWTFRLDNRISVSSLTFSPDGSKLLVGSADGSVRLFGLRSGSLIKTITIDSSTNETNNSKIKMMNDILYSTFLPDENEIFVATSSGSFDICNLRSGSAPSKSTSLTEFQKSLKSSDATSSFNYTEIDFNVAQVATIPTRSDTFLVSINTNALFLYNPASNTVIQQYTAKVSSSASITSDEKSKKPATELNMATSSHRGRFVYAGSIDGIVYVFNLENGVLLRGFRAHPSPITSIINHPFQSLLATTSSDGKIKLWK